MRFAAVALNGLFIAVAAGGGWFGGSSLGKSVVMILGSIVFAGGFIGLVGCRRERSRLAQLQAKCRAPSTHVTVKIWRSGIELGCDDGLVYRDDGALVFEGEFTRFAIVRDDLEEEVDPAQPTLKVRSKDGRVEVEFVPRQGDGSSLANLLRGWPDAVRYLPGPPASVQPRNALWYAAKTSEKFLRNRAVLVMMVPAMVSLITQILFRSRGGIEQTVMFALGSLAILFLFIAILYTPIFIAFYRRTVGEDDANLARLAALDARTGGDVGTVHRPEDRHVTA